jgi:hypothetical protein
MSPKRTEITDTLELIESGAPSEGGRVLLRAGQGRGGWLIMSENDWTALKNHIITGSLDVRTGAAMITEGTA